MNKVYKSCLGILVILFYLMGSLSGLLAQSNDIDFDNDPSLGNWLEKENTYFRFIFKPSDSKLVEELLSISQDVYEIVTGYFQCLPEKKPDIILYGVGDSPPYGGVTTFPPLRIGLAVPAIQYISAKSLFIHEFTHYMHGTTNKTGMLFWPLDFFYPDIRKMSTVAFSDLSMEGSTSFLEGNRLSHWASLPIRAAVLEGQMWNYDQVSTGALRYPGGLRVYLSGMLIQDWLFDRFGEEAHLKILDLRSQEFFITESQAFKEYTDLDFKTAWGQIRSRLTKKYAFAWDLPKGTNCTPVDADLENQWFALMPSEKGFLHFRRDLKHIGRLGFWRPGELPEDSQNEELIPGSDNSGSFVPIQGLISNDYAVNHDSTLVAAIVNSPADTYLTHYRNINQLALADILWSDDDNEAVARNIRVLKGEGFVSPCLSPDGKRLFAGKRVSDFYYAVEYNMETDTISALNIPKEFCIVTLDISPDGKKLAVRFINKGMSDVGIYDLQSNQFTAVTNDEAFDTAPRFLSDNRFVFSSDRENTVAVYSYADGVFKREFIEDVAAFFPVDDGMGGFYYSSYSSRGRVIRHLNSSDLLKENIPSFLDLRPDWIERRNMIWSTYREKGARLYSEKITDSAKDDKQVSETVPFLDVAMPQYWSPLFNYGLEGIHYGAMVYASSYLGENTYITSLLYNPDSNQLSGSLSVNLAFPFIYLNFNLNQKYYETLRGNGSNVYSIYTLNRMYNFNFNLPLFTAQSYNGVFSRLFLFSDISFQEQIENSERFSILESFGPTSNKDIVLKTGLSWNQSWPAPPYTLFGSSHFNAGVFGLSEWKDIPSSPSFGSIVNLETALFLNPMLITLFGNGVWRQSNDAKDLLPRIVSRWYFPGSSPLFSRAGIRFSFSFLDKEISDYILLTEQFGLELEAKSFWESDYSLNPRWLNELEFSCDFVNKLVINYSSLVIRYGIGYRYQFNDVSGDEFGLENFCFRLNIGGQAYNF